MSKHTLISPSNFERRMLCPGSLNAEKDLPVTTSIYAEKGTLLHDRVNKLINGHKEWKKDLTDDLQDIVRKAQAYFYSVKQDKKCIVDLHEQRFNLDFLTPPFEDMGGTVDSVVFCYDEKNDIYESLKIINHFLLISVFKYFLNKSNFHNCIIFTLDNLFDHIKFYLDLF